MDTVVILGAGQAGGWAAMTLRDEGFAGRVVLIGEEEFPPYERPPLSKDLLLGIRSSEATYLWPRSKLEELKIECLFGCYGNAILRDRKIVVLSDGESISYDKLMLTTGARVRKLVAPGADLDGIHYLRNLKDAAAVKESLVDGSQLLVVGGGWLGLEVAAAARCRGAKVRIVESTNQLCARVLPKHFADYLQSRHESNGVTISLNSTALRFNGTQRVESVALSNGEITHVDSVVIAIGVIPNLEVAKEAGIEVADGIIVDDQGKTSDINIYAAGDIACQRDPQGKFTRLESWANAQNQAICAARSLLGGTSRYQDVPYFWSDQYDFKVQILGSFASYDDVVQRGTDAGEQTSFFLKDNRIVAVLGVNRPQEVAVARRLLQRNLVVEPSQLMAAKTLNELLKSAVPAP
jgi:3-phenylpropionate/trans-cinnamate dioxygenase ferredoxin reductase component